MKDLVDDAIVFFKMVGESDALSDKGFDVLSSDKIYKY